MPFPNITGTGRSSRELARDLLEKAHVALIPGESFGANGDGYLRTLLCRERSRTSSEALDANEGHFCWTEESGHAGCGARGS